VRVSSDLQDVENSIARQTRACREWAERNGHAILDHLIFIDEEKSGSSVLARSAFQRLLTMLQGRGSLPFDAVLVDEDSRLERGGVLGQLAAMFQARHVHLISVDAGRDLTQDDQRLLNHIKSAMNEEYLHELSRRTREGQASMVLKGFHAGGRIFGYHLIPEWPPEIPPENRPGRRAPGSR
jgi:DNA invertase Pin-like site-specific DNA recombinase